MKKTIIRVLKWIGFGIGGLVLLIAVLAGVGTLRWPVQANKVYAVPEVSLAGLKPDVAHGAYLVRAGGGCVMCHGDDLGGATIMEDPVAGSLSGPNITSAALKDWTDGEIARVLHHGIHKSGRSLLLMPAGTYQHYSREDVAAMVAFLRTTPPVVRERRPTRIGWLIKALWVVGLETELFAAENVDHAAAFVAAVPVGPTHAYGKYIYTAHCAGCHFEHGRGGRMKSGPPDWPPASNLTEDGAGGWTKAEFIKAFRTGINPSGSAIRPPMGDALERYGKKVKETDLVALWEYLRTLKGEDL